MFCSEYVSETSPVMVYTFWLHAGKDQMITRKEILEDMREETLKSMFRQEIQLDLVDSLRFTLIRPDQEKMRMELEAERSALVFEIDKRKKAIEIIERKIKEEK